MKAMVTEDCVSCGLCVDVCPEVFDLGPDQAEVKLNPVPVEHEVAVRKAAEECPVMAIVLEE